MGVTEDAGAKAHTLREEVNQLFGLRWDNLVEWVIIVWASAWLYSSWAVNNSIVFPQEGPIEWIASVLRLLDVQPPAWLAGIPHWLTDPSRGWLLGTFMALSAVFTTLAVRHYDRAGLRFIALVAMMLALEVSEDAWPLIGTALLAAVPAAIAFVWGFVHNAQAGSDKDRSSYYFPPAVIRMFIEGALGIYAMPIAAPFVLAYSLVDSYRTKLPYEPSRDLARLAIRELHDQPQKLADADTFTVVSALAAVLTAGPSTRTSRNIAGTAHYYLEQRHDARVRAARREQDRRYSLNSFHAN